LDETVLALLVGPAVALLVSGALVALLPNSGPAQGH